MSDVNYLAFLEEQFSASAGERPEPPDVRLSSFAGAYVDQVRMDSSYFGVARLLKPTSRLGPALGLTERDIFRAAHRLDAAHLLPYEQAVLKRAFDVLVGLTLGVATLPLLAVVAILIRLDSRGPIFLTQQRLGLDGRVFRMVKLRTLDVNDEAAHLPLAAVSDGEGAGGVLFKMRNDPRITRVGRVLRALSLDELPQFLNVLRGDMSLVGPRPPLPAEITLRPPLRVQPGITGLWAMGDRASARWAEESRRELRYATGWTLGRDLRILVKTAFAVVTPHPPH